MAVREDIKPVSVRTRAYRRRLAVAGRKQVLIDLPAEIVTFIDDLKQRHGLPSRRLALLRLIEMGRHEAEQQIS
jgi:hypothetical protein